MLGQPKQLPKCLGSPSSCPSTWAAQAVVWYSSIWLARALGLTHIYSIISVWNYTKKVGNNVENCWCSVCPSARTEQFVRALGQSSLPERSGRAVSLPERSGRAVSLPESSGRAVSLPEHSGRAVSLPEHLGRAVSLPEHSGRAVSLPERSVRAVSLPERSGRAVSLLERSGRAVSLPMHSGRAVSLPERSGRAVSLPEGSGRAVSLPEGSGRAVSLPERSGQLPTPHKFGSRGPSLLQKSKFLIDHYEKTQNWVFERSLVVLEEKCQLLTPHKFGSRVHRCWRKLKFLASHYEKTQNWVFEWPLVVLEEKCQLPTPHKFGSRGPSLLTEIKISHRPLWNNTKLGFWKVPGGPRGKVSITDLPQIWVKGSFVVDGNQNFSSDIMKKHKIGFLNSPWWSWRKSVNYRHPTNLDQGVHRCWRKIKISHRPLWKNTKLGFWKVPGGPRGKVSITDPPQIWVKGSIVVDGNRNFSSAIIKNTKLGFWTVPGGPGGKVSNTDPPQIWVKGSIVVDGNRNFSSAIMKKHKLVGQIHYTLIFVLCLLLCGKHICCSDSSCRWWEHPTTIYHNQNYLNFLHIVAVGTQKQKLPLGPARALGQRATWWNFHYLIFDITTHQIVE